MTETKVSLILLYLSFVRSEHLPYLCTATVFRTDNQRRLSPYVRAPKAPALCYVISVVHCTQSGTLCGLVCSSFCGSFSHLLRGVVDIVCSLINVSTVFNGELESDITVLELQTEGVNGNLTAVDLDLFIFDECPVNFFVRINTAELVVLFLGIVNKTDVSAVNVNLFFCEIKLSCIVGFRSELVIGTFFAEKLGAFEIKSLNEYGVDYLEKMLFINFVFDLCLLGHILCNAVKLVIDLGFAGLSTGTEDGNYGADQYDNKSERLGLGTEEEDNSDEAYNKADDKNNVYAFRCEILLVSFCFHTDTVP